MVKAKSPGNSTNVHRVMQQKIVSGIRRLSSTLSETASCEATTTQTFEVQDDEDTDGGETDTSFASSRGSESANYGGNDFWKYAYIAILILLLSIISLTFQGGEQNKSDLPYENYIKSLRSVIKHQFPNISKENRDILRLIGQNVLLESDNLAPLVVLFQGNGSKQFSEAISEAIQKAKAEGLKSSGTKSITVRSDTNRAELHQNLRETLDSSGTSHLSPRIAVVLNVDLLKWDAVLVLHAFADHEKYPVPRTVLLLTVSSYDDSPNCNCDDQMVRFLTNRWIENGGSSDNIPPIISRISYFVCV